MPLRSSRLSKWSIYIIISSLLLLLFLLIFLIVVYFYPIPTVTNNFNSAHYSKFLAPWPISALDQEIIDRKRLKRYAKGEQIRRMEKQLQRMEILSIPIYDLFLDANAEVSVPRFANSPDDSAFLWPILPGRKIFNNILNPNYYRKSSEVIFPTNHWAHITEGILLLGGEEVKATIPLVKGRRIFSFNLFLLSPGSIRISLGQYVWAKSFTDDDVQKKLHFSIPINDSTATVVKIISISSSFYLLNANVNHMEHSGRSTIRVSATSQFWSANKDYLIANQKPEEESNADTNDQDETEEEKFLEDAKPEEAKFEELTNNPKSPVITKKETKKIEQVQDPLNQIANQQVLTNDIHTTAFGYNIVFLQIPKINENIIRNKKMFTKAAPNLANLFEQSITFNKSLHISDNVSENYRRFIFSDPNFLNSENISIVKEEMNIFKSKNTYYQLRKYGYNIVGISYPDAFYYSKGITDTADFSSVYGKWLEKNDWNFANKNLKIDDRNLPVTGLDAIFKTSVKGISPSLTARDFSVISNYLTQASQNIDNIPDWGANEYILINSKELYIPRVIEAFQNWSKDNQQSRFLAHLLLDPDNNMLRPTIKELGRSIATLGFSSLLNPLEVSNLSNISYIDKAVGQLLDTIKARKIENRTIVFVLIPHENNEFKKNNVATGILKIPGLIPKKNINFEKISIDDVVATLLTNVGIPIEKNNANIIENKQGIVLENITDNEYKSFKANKITFKNNYVKYNLVIKPDENNCSPFIWKSLQEPIINVQSNYPIHQVIADNQIEIFPCAIKNKFVHLSWYQKSNKSNLINENIETFLGGNFQYKKDNLLLPVFYFGKNLIPFNNVSFYFDNISIKEAEEIFSIDEKNLKKSVRNIRENFNAIDIFESKNIEEQTLSKKTKIGFLITPL